VRIRGELLKLGHRVSTTSIRNLLRRHQIPPALRRAGLTWRRFLRAHGKAILACDYFTVDTVYLKRLYVLFFLELASRRIVFTACSEQPGDGWAVQQARNLTWELEEAGIKPRFLIHDRDSNFPAAFDAVFRAEGLEVIRTPVRAPHANARWECWISSARRECGTKTSTGALLSLPTPRGLAGLWSLPAYGPDLYPGEVKRTNPAKPSEVFRLEAASDSLVTVGRPSKLVVRFASPKVVERLPVMATLEWILKDIILEILPGPESFIP